MALLVSRPNNLEQLFVAKRIGGAIMTGTLLVFQSCSININITIQNSTKMEKSKKIVIPAFNTPFKIHNATAESNNGKSQTVQGESYTIQELIKRHVNGLMPPVGLTPLYDHDEPTHEDSTILRKPDFDLTDIDEVKKTITETNKKLSNAQKAKAKKDAEQVDRLSVAKAENKPE